MKPELTLTHLNRREPIVHFGCTWTEIKTCLWRGAAVALPLTVLLMAVAPVPVLMVVPGLVGWWALAYGFARHIHRHRAGKPLHYERHRKTARRPRPFDRERFTKSSATAPRAAAGRGQRPRPGEEVAVSVAKTAWGQSQQELRFRNRIIGLLFLLLAFLGIGLWRMPRFSTSTCRRI